MNHPDLTPEERRRQLDTIPADIAPALRLTSAMAAGDAPASHAIITEIGASGRAVVVLTAMAVMATRLAHALQERCGFDADGWLHLAALELLDEAEATRAALEDTPE
jgi:hypothetical protein